MLGRQSLEGGVALISLGRVLISLALSGVVATSSIGSTALVVVVVVDMRGEPLPGARVELRQVGQPAEIAETGPSGIARLYLRRASKYDLEVSHEGFATSRRKGLSLEEKGPTVVGVAITLPDPCPVDKKNKSGVQICM